MKSQFNENARKLHFMHLNYDQISKCTLLLHISRSYETRFQQNPFLKPTVDIFQELHVVLANLTAVNEARFINADCMQFEIFKVEKLFRDIVFKTTGFLDLWPYTSLFHIPVQRKRNVC